MNTKFEFVKRLLLLVLLCLLCSVFFVGCDESNEMRIDTQLTVDESFSGRRVITVKLPESITGSSSALKDMEQLILDNCPDNLEYTNSSSDSGEYVFTLSFSSRNEYCEGIKNITGYEPIVSFGMYDNLLTKGWSIYEDFTVVDTMKWLEDAVIKSENKKLEFVFDTASKPVVTVAGTTGSSSSSGGNIVAGDLTGSPVHSVEIQTTNYKNKTYDRKIVLTFPESTYEKLGEELEDYISELAGPTAAESWTKSGNYRVFEAFYKNIDSTSMGNFTANLLGCSDESVIYGDINNSSTALAEQLVFEENLNLLGFIPENGKNVQLTYGYTLPAVTSTGDGLIKSNGEWVKSGSWNDGKFTIEASSPALRIRIPDGIQYSVSGIDIVLSRTENNTLSRTMDFVYLPEEANGYNYACSYFGNLGVPVTQELADNGKLICRIETAGNANSISEQLGKLFGGGNYLSSSTDSKLTSVVTKFEFTDCMNIEYMLSQNNSDVPITYTFVKGSGEYITSISAESDGNETSPKINNEEEQIKMTLASGKATVKYSGTAPYSDGIILCSVVFGLLLVFAITLVMSAISKNRIYKERLKQNEIRRKNTDVQ